MTGAQASYLKTLCEEAGEEFDPSLNKADASKMIDALQAKTGRGKTSGHGVRLAPWHTPRTAAPTALSRPRPGQPDANHEVIASASR